MQGMHESERLARQVNHTLAAAGARLVVFDGVPAVVYDKHAAPVAAEPHDPFVGAVHKTCVRCRDPFFGNSPSLVCVSCDNPRYRHRAGDEPGGHLQGKAP